MVLEATLRRLESLFMSRESLTLSPTMAEVMICRARIRSILSVPEMVIMISDYMTEDDGDDSNDNGDCMTVFVMPMMIMMIVMTMISRTITNTINQPFLLKELRFSMILSRTFLPMTESSVKAGEGSNPSSFN